MGQVLVKAKIENLKDLLSAKDGLQKPDQVRSVEVDDALVDTGAKLLSLPRRLVQQFGLEHFETRPARTSAGTVPCEIYRAVWLTIAGRQCTVDVAEVPDECPVLIGYVPLELPTAGFTLRPIALR